MATTVDRARYPQLAAYIDQLPDGLASYPECRAKATLLVSAFETLDVSRLGEGLPEEVVGVFRNPPAPGLWVPGTWSDAIFYTIADAFYPSEEAVMEWTRRRTQRTMNKKIYRAILMITRPKTLLGMASAFHSLAQKGTTLSAERGDKTAKVRLEHPPYLHGGLNHRSNVPMFEVLIEGARGLNVQVEMTASMPTYATYEATWE